MNTNKLCHLEVVVGHDFELEFDVSDDVDGANVRGE
jgi:hypothetical protein